MDPKRVHLGHIGAAIAVPMRSLRNARSRASVRSSAVPASRL
jgi:hypothetical protein